MFVAIGSSGVIITCPDVITWTKQTSVIMNELTNITYENKMFATVKLVR
jgi:hypothetical protein